MALKICITCSCFTSSHDKHAGPWLFIKIQTWPLRRNYLTTETRPFPQVQHPVWAAAQILKDTSKRQDACAWPTPPFFSSFPLHRRAECKCHSFEKSSQVQVLPPHISLTSVNVVATAPGYLLNARCTFAEIIRSISQRKGKQLNLQNKGHWSRYFWGGPAQNSVQNTATREQTPPPSISSRRGPRVSSVSRSYCGADRWDVPLRPETSTIIMPQRTPDRLLETVYTASTTSVLWENLHLAYALTTVPKSFHSQVIKEIIDPALVQTNN